MTRQELPSPLESKLELSWSSGSEIRVTFRGSLVMFVDIFHSQITMSVCREGVEEFTEFLMRFGWRRWSGSILAMVVLSSLLFAVLFLYLQVKLWSK